MAPASVFTHQEPSIKKHSPDTICWGYSIVKALIYTIFWTRIKITQYCKALLKGLRILIIVYYSLTDEVNRLARKAGHYTVRIAPALRMRQPYVLIANSMEEEVEQFLIHNHDLMVRKFELSDVASEVEKIIEEVSKLESD